MKNYIKNFDEYSLNETNKKHEGTGDIHDKKLQTMLDKLDRLKEIEFPNNDRNHKDTLRRYIEETENSIEIEKLSREIDIYRSDVELKKYTERIEDLKRKLAEAETKEKTK